MTWAELEHKLKKAPNCKFLGFNDGQAWWKNTKTGEQFKTSRHSSQELSKNLADKILKRAGLK